MKNLYILLILVSSLVGCNDQLTSKRASVLYSDVPQVQTLFSVQGEQFIKNINWATKNTITIEGFNYQVMTLPLFLGNISDKTMTPITVGGTIPSGCCLALSPDGKNIAFFTEAELIVMPMSQLGKDDARLNDYIVKGTSVFGSLAWSFDGKQLAILGGTHDILELWFYDPVTGNLKNIFRYPLSNIRQIRNLSWSSEGNELAFSIEFENADNKNIQSDVFIYQVLEKNLIRVTSTGDDEAYPSWYPLGNILTYTLTRRGDAESVDSMLVFATKDGACKKTFSQFRGILNPSWSPSGLRIAFRTFTEIKVFNVAQIIPSEYLSPQALCK